MCKVCFCDLELPFTLQGCGHKFCSECIKLHLEQTLKDVTIFPIKCPSCSENILLEDI